MCILITGKLARLAMHIRVLLTTVLPPLFVLQLKNHEIV